MVASEEKRGVGSTPRVCDGRVACCVPYPMGFVARNSSFGYLLLVICSLMEGRVWFGGLGCGFRDRFARRGPALQEGGLLRGIHHWGRGRLMEGGNVVRRVRFGRREPALQEGGCCAEFIIGGFVVCELAIGGDSVCSMLERPGGDRRMAWACGSADRRSWAAYAALSPRSVFPA
jgi:hypothetical protein